MRLCDTAILLCVVLVTLQVGCGGFAVGAEGVNQNMPGLKGNNYKERLGRRIVFFEALEV